MRDPNPSPPALEMVSVDLIEDWSKLLPDPERSAFVRACTEAGADEGHLQSILARSFSTWKTTLMADDLRRLQMLAMAKYEQIRCYVKVIWLEDETDKIGYDDVPPWESFVLWPRLEDRQVVTEALGVEVLKAMLASQQLRPDRLEIRDKRSIYAADASLDPETAAILACNIFDGADLAITALTLWNPSAYETIIAAELSAEHQGQGLGFSLVRKAALSFTGILNPDSYWADKILRHGLALKELSLSFTQSWTMSPCTTPPLPRFIADNTVWPALEKFELQGGSTLPVSTIMAILSNSQQSLTGISFSLLSLGDKSTWADLLSRIANEYPHLTWFKLTNLAEGCLEEERSISFMSLLDKDLVASEPYKSGLKITQRGTGVPRVVYEGPNASQVLGIVAECAVAKSRS